MASSVRGARLSRVTRTIAAEERRARLAHRHRLLAGRRTDDVPALVEDLVALHSSDPVSVFLSAAARMDHPGTEPVEKALYEQRDVVRHHAMRRTLWVATRDAVRAMHAATTLRLVGAERRRTLGLLKASGVADPEAWLDDARDQVLAALHEHGPMTARALGERVPALRQPLQLAPGKKYAATVSAHTRVLLGLGFEGALVRTRPTGTWINGQYTWAAMDTWLPGGVDGMDPRAAARDLVGRYLSAFGPVTTEDVQWWTGLPVTTVRRALADCGAVEVDLDGAPGWLAAGDEDPGSAADEPWVALLPGLDPTTMGWKLRDWYLDATSADAFDRNGNAGPTVWADGRVVGAWAQRPDGEIRTHLFTPLARAHRVLLEERVEQLRQVLDGARFTPRFPGVVHATLLA